MGLLIGATEFAQKGKELQVTCDKKADGEEVEDWNSMVPHLNFDQYMHPYHFKEFCHFLPEVWLGYNLKESNDPWWQFQAAVGQFNNLRSERIHAYCWKVVDELMSAYRPRTAKLGNLPNISFVMCKPEPLGKFFCLLSILFYFLFHFFFLHKPTFCFSRY